MSSGSSAVPLRIGWAQADLTPERPVLVSGQFHCRVSEKVADPITVTALALDSGTDHAVLVSCDYVVIPNDLREAVRKHLGAVPGLDPRKVAFNATHTHTGPELRIPVRGGGFVSGTPGVDLPEAMPIAEYLAFAAPRIARAVVDAWNARRPGAVAFGLGYAVVGRNRRWVDTAGRTTMYGNTDQAGFSHIEGYEDHSVNVLATYSEAGVLTGLVVNVPCPSQVSEHEFLLSADYWCETRAELRRRFGSALFVLPQCSAAGDQSPHLLYGKAAEARMRELRGRTQRQEIAARIGRAVDDALGCIGSTASASPVLRHLVEDLDLPMNRLTEADVRQATEEAARLQADYEAEIRRLEADPALKRQPRWYQKATALHRRKEWLLGVAVRYEKQQAGAGTLPVEFHVIRLGEIVFSTSPFEYYLDFGVFIKARSPAVQTFLVQLTGAGTYCPSRRSVLGGAYGSLPASNPVGPEGGRLLAERSVELIRSLWA